MSDDGNDLDAERKTLTSVPPDATPTPDEDADDDNEG